MAFFVVWVVLYCMCRFTPVGLGCSQITPGMADLQANFGWEFKMNKKKFTCSSLGVPCLIHFSRFLLGVVWFIFIAKRSMLKSHRKYICQILTVNHAIITPINTTEMGDKKTNSVKMEKIEFCHKNVPTCIFSI